MKIQKKNRPPLKNPLTWIMLLVIIVLIFVVLEKTHVTNFIKMPLDPNSPAAQEVEQKKADDARKKELIENTPEPTAAAPPQDSDSITLTTAQEANSVTILTKLKGFSGGTCELSVKNATKTYEASADIIYQPEFSSCAGFTVPVSKLGTGRWAITLNTTPTDGEVLTKSTTLEVK